eukprot:GHVS01068232.1.p1 GENE.GHVS01068232.1~~GHVS01068232.1.p1  ORF type:complete len:400 (-),score=35.86 GHVS01068232.1:704-1903(-)
MKIFNIILLAIIAAIATARLSVAPRNKSSKPKNRQFKHRSRDVSDVDEAASSTVSGVVDAATSASGEDEFTATSDSEGDKSTVTNASAKGISRAAKAYPELPISNSTAGGAKSRDTTSDSRADNPIGNGESGGDTTVGTKKGKEPLTKEEQLKKYVNECRRKLPDLLKRQERCQRKVDSLRKELHSTTLSGSLYWDKRANLKSSRKKLDNLTTAVHNTQSQIEEEEKMSKLGITLVANDFKDCESYSTAGDDNLVTEPDTTTSDSRADNPIGNIAAGGGKPVGTKKLKDTRSEEDQMEKDLQESKMKLAGLVERSNKLDANVKRLDVRKSKGYYNRGEFKVLIAEHKKAANELGRTMGCISETEGKIERLTFRMQELANGAEVDTTDSSSTESSGDDDY